MANKNIGQIAVTVAAQAAHIDIHFLLSYPQNCLYYSNPKWWKFVVLGNLFKLLCIHAGDVALRNICL
ncbi:unnamed protein product [Pieris brassicae]|uniref:Uncharacterized protein n=1 Tax=Pieris brassicae TaxID=7116 RepID=A0A9P0TNI9_PIEBR|nr:unnamed protein product [Pieris brassicae]